MVNIIGLGYHGKQAEEELQHKQGETRANEQAFSSFVLIRLLHFVLFQTLEQRRGAGEEDCISVGCSRKAFLSKREQA